MVQRAWLAGEMVLINRQYTTATRLLALNIEIRIAFSPLQIESWIASLRSESTWFW